MDLSFYVVTDIGFEILAFILCVYSYKCRRAICLYRDKQKEEKDVIITFIPRRMVGKMVACISGSPIVTLGIFKEKTAKIVATNLELLFGSKQKVKSRRNREGRFN